MREIAHSLISFFFPLQVAGTENVAVHIQNNWRANTKLRSGHLHMISIAGTNVISKEALLRTAAFLQDQWGLETVRSHLDVVRDPTNVRYDTTTESEVNMMRLVVQEKGRNGDPLDLLSAEDWKKIEGQVRRLKWLDAETFALAKMPVDIEKAGDMLG